MFKEQLKYNQLRLEDAAKNGTDMDSAYWRGRVDAAAKANVYATLLEKALVNALNCLCECDRFCANVTPDTVNCDCECETCDHRCICYQCRNCDHFIWNGTEGSGAR